ncbi:hypothetical protein E0198_001294 [Clavispora lusitaniae]|nr:hypothetical protein E0198_001294 [Clavispora lusitaniae]
MTKYALVTGAGSGIGYELAKAFHRRKYVVLGLGTKHDIPGMNTLKEQIDLVPIVADVTNVNDIKAAVEDVRSVTGGRLDVLYNNAGVCNVGGPAIELDDDGLRRLLDVNVLGQMYMTKYMSDFVIAARGSIVFTASVAARVPLSWTSAYCASKAAIDQYALVLHGEMQPFGVRVHSVITGGVDTAIADSLGSKVHKNKAGEYPSEHFNVSGMRDSVEAATNMSRSHRSQSAADYAEDIVGKVESRSSRFNLYGGYGGYFLHWLRWYAPVWVMEWGVQTWFKQRRVFDEIRAKYAGK